MMCTRSRFMISTQADFKSPGSSTFDYGFNEDVFTIHGYGAKEIDRK